MKLYNDQFEKRDRLFDYRKQPSAITQYTPYSDYNIRYNDWYSCIVCPRVLSFIPRGRFNYSLLGKNRNLSAYFHSTVRNPHPIERKQAKYSFVTFDSTNEDTMPVYSARARIVCILYNSPERKKKLKPFFFSYLKNLEQSLQFRSKLKIIPVPTCTLASKLIPRLAVRLRSSSRKGKGEGNEIAERLSRFTCARHRSRSDRPRR